LRAYLTKLREEAYIDIKPGFVDSGASPRQTKPVFSAYAPPTPKKKTVQQKQRFDRGGRFSTVSKNAAPVAPAASAAAPAATTAAPADVSSATVPVQTAKKVVSSKPSKPKKIKREKVRFGQAPRNALPPGPQETAVGAGAGEASSTQTAVGDAGSAIAPGTAIAPTESTTQVLGAQDADPLAPKPVSTGKTRFSDRARTMAAEKVAKKEAVVKQKAAFTPAPATTQEKADQAAQATPLGLNGDTATRKKKKREKGAPKERLQNKQVAPPVQAPAPEPTVNPSLGATPAGVTPAPIPSQTPAPQSNPPAPAPQPNN
ncbi:MAG: hypothetical protein JST61_00185, partial [Acidobacteria bacterium]|nr:hypothetical protein [Acidobacteriota bacterium]